MVKFSAHVAVKPLPFRKGGLHDGKEGLYEGLDDLLRSASRAGRWLAMPAQAIAEGKYLRNSQQDPQVHLFAMRGVAQWVVPHQMLWLRARWGWVLGEGVRSALPATTSGQRRSDYSSVISRTVRESIDNPSFI
jgi:hypothetical protein